MISVFLIILYNYIDFFSPKLVTRILLSDAGFQLGALEFMLGSHDNESRTEGATAAAASVKKMNDKPFDFQTCEYLVKCN